MQLSYFTNGGYAVHKAFICGRKFSAWFDEDGKLKDAEQFDKIGRSRQVKRQSKDWSNLQATYGNKHNFAEFCCEHCTNDKTGFCARI